MKSYLGYVFGGFLVAFAFAVAGIAWSSATSTMRGMQRVVMPGRATVTLPIGPSTLYAETRSTLDDRSYAAPPDLRVHCAVDDARIALRDVASPVRYDLAGYTGRSVYDVIVTDGGRYALTCDAAQPFVIAIGAGVGSWLVVVAIALIPGVAGVGLVIATVIRRRRRR